MGVIHSLYNLYRLKRRLYWPQEKLEVLRRRKLLELLHFCYRNIPYYQEQFKLIGAEPEDFKCPEDLKAFPILEKETLRDRSEEFLSPGVNKNDLMQYSSSGSTGIPLQLFYLPSERLRMGFTVTRELLYNGLKPWYSMVNITEPRHSSSKNRWYHRLGVMNEQFLSLYDESHLNLERLNEIRPQVLIGFPSVLILIGEEISRQVKSTWRPKFIFTLAEVLTEEYRQAIKSVWGVEPIDMYGANEVGHIAFQCSLRRGYHINADSVHLEIVANGQPVNAEERGEVVVTNFDLRVMPIIRYRVGDVAQRLETTCPCGCIFPLMGKIAGRSDGFIMGDNGKIFSALEVSLLLKNIVGVKQFRLYQKSNSEILVEWVSTGENGKTEEDIITALQNRLGDHMQIATKQVSSIARDKSGKIRSVVSTIQNPFWDSKV